MHTLVGSDFTLKCGGGDGRRGQGRWGMGGGEANHHPGTVSVGIRSGLSSYHSLDKLKQQGFRSQQAKVFNSESSSLSPTGPLEPHGFPISPVRVADMPRGQQD